jgi:long-chain acyl-CoA synthetase
VVPAPIEEQIALSPYILQCMIEGTNKPHNVAVIVLDVESVKGWCKENGVPTSDMLTHSAVKELIKKEIEGMNGDIKRYEQPRDFILTDEEWTPENGFLTPKMSLKRRKVMEVYGDDLEALYQK